MYSSAILSGKCFGVRQDENIVCCNKQKWRLKRSHKHDLFRQLIQRINFRSSKEVNRGFERLWKKSGSCEGCTGYVNHWEWQVE